MSQKLTNIDNSFQELSKEIKVMGDDIVGAIWDLSYVTEQSNEILEPFNCFLNFTLIFLTLLCHKVSY